MGQVVLHAEQLGTDQLELLVADSLPPCCLLLPSYNRWYVEAIKYILYQSMSE